MPTLPRTLARLALLAAALPAAGKEPVIASLQDLVSAEVRSQGFHLARPTQVHVYARGGGLEYKGDPGPLYAFGWILDATTRQVVWQMQPGTVQKAGRYRVADAYVDLPAGSYEVYFANHAYAQRTFFARWERNIDRRGREDERPEFWQSFLGISPTRHRDAWAREARNFGLELYDASPDPQPIATFTAPLAWRGEAVSLLATGDDQQLTQGFRCTRPVTLHVYAQGEGDAEERRFHDQGWIVDARTRKRVWSLAQATCGWGGGARKNLRAMDRITLPAGDYLATYVTDGSHSPADWNAAPPWDPTKYGLVLAATEPGDAKAITLLEASDLEGKIVAELVGLKTSERASRAFTLSAPGAIRIFAMGEWTEGDWHDWGWLEDAKGKVLWTMEGRDGEPAGGARKNRQVEDFLQLPKGTYTLHYRMDSSHGPGNWNSTPPRNKNRYGITVYAMKAPTTETR